MSKRELLEFARKMRSEPTVSEAMFWQAVRNRRLGPKFRRQQIIERFIVDFFVPSHKLIVEIDGDIHRSLKERDSLREQFLNDCGLRVLRFTATEVENNLPQVLDELRKVLAEQEETRERPY